MIIPPKYILTPQITKFLQEIEAAREVIDSFPLSPIIESNLRRQSLLKSSVYSARIEGNPLTLDEYPNRTSRDQKKIEINNILKGIQLIQERHARDISIQNLLNIHKTVMYGLTDKTNLGNFRHEVSAIFNSAGIAIYMPPPPRQVPKLIERLLNFTNNSKEPFIPIRAALAHYSFEKIHPFLDGNGRVGRLLITAVMAKGGYGMRGLLSIEEYLDNHRSTYYRALEESERDVTGFVEFMLEAIDETATEAKQLVLTKQSASVEDFLLPRRAEILRIIKDQKMVNFDMIKRRFLKINDRTLRYDLKSLTDAGLIKKRGTTKGVYYEAV